MDETLELLCTALLRHEAALRALPGGDHQVHALEVEDRKRKIQRCERWLHLLDAESVLDKARAHPQFSTLRGTLKT